MKYSFYLCGSFKTLFSMMKQLFLFSLFLLTVFQAKATTITFTNHTDLQRHEVVEVPLTTVPQQPFVVLDAFGLEQPYQLTYDGKLLLFVSVRPHGTAAYTINDGQPNPMKSSVFTKMYPERLDDIVIENDRSGYRFYGPALQRTGERGYGIDLWLKNTSELVVDSLYRLHFSRYPEIVELRKQKRYREADSLANLTTFHLNHGFGMDCYNVGPTLGCGTPALMHDGQLLFPWCYETFRVLDNGPLRVTVELTFSPVQHAEVAANPIVEHRLVTLDRGSNFAKMQVWYDGLTQPTDVCAGFVIHEADVASVVLGNNYIHYADPTGDALKHNCQIYVATLFPDGIGETKQLMYEAPKNGNAGHAIGVKHDLKDQERFTYYFGSAWSQYDVHSQAEWQLRVNDFITARQQPLTVDVQ